MQTISDVAGAESTITAGTIPFHPGVPEYRDADGKVIMWVKDDDEGRSLFLGVEAYGEISAVTELRYDDWVDVVSRMMGTVIMQDSTDPFNELLKLGGTESD